MASEYKFNFRGPDITGVELASLLDKIPSARQCVINMTSCQRRLYRVSAEGQPRGDYRYQDRHGKERHCFRALLGGSAARSGGGRRQERDLSRRSKPSISPSRRPTSFMTRRSAWPPSIRCWKIPAKAKATENPERRNGEGKLAAAFPVVRLGANAAAARDPDKKPLLDKKEQLEQAIDKLKYEKAAMPADQYKKQLTQLLLELAKTQEALDKQ